MDARVRVAVQECKRLAEDFASENAMGAVYKTSASRTDKRRAKLHAAIDALAALSLHVGDVSDVQSDVMGASASPTALSAPALRASAPIAGAGGQSDRWIPVTERLPAFHQSVALLDVRRRENCSFDRNIHDAGARARPEGARPEEIAQPSPHIEPAEYSDEWLLQRARKAQATIDSLPPDLRATFYAASATLPALPTTPTEGPAQTLTDAAELAAEVIRVAESEAELLKDEGMLPESMGALRVADRLRRAIESKVRAGTLTDPEGAS